jgi:hypothetical protein
MSYIGNQPTTVAFLTDQFSGTGSQTAFTLSAAPANTNSILVSVSGVLQDPTTYSVSGTTLTFSAAPPSGTGNISVRFLGIPASGVTTTAYRTVTEFTATAGQTTFTPPSYTVGYINVYRNGALLGTADYTATNGTTVVLASAASSGDLVVVESFLVSSVLNAIPNGVRSVNTSNLPVGTVLQVVTGTYATGSTISSSTYADTGITASITPSSSTNKVLVLVAAQGLYLPSGGATNDNIRVKLVRNSTDINQIAGQLFYRNSTSVAQTGAAYASYLDSPSTTSSTTYKIQWSSENGRTVNINVGGETSTITLMEIAA